MEVFGENINIRDFTHLKLLDFRDKVLCKMPSNRTKFNEYKGKSYTDIIKMPGVKPMSIVTVNDDLVMLSSFFKWCCKHGYIQSNVAEGLRLERSKKAKAERDTYSKEELEKIIAGLRDETLKKDCYPWKFWIPIIAMYSGMRQGEIAQLYLADVKKDESGVWYFDINENSDDKKVKTSNSKRCVPVHPELVKLGLLDYCAKLSKKKNPRLWPELEFKRDGYGQTFQRWYGRFNRTCVTDNPKKVFHSFRHTFSNNLRQKSVSTDQIKALVGHDSGDVTDRYAKDFTILQLFESISKLDYGIDIKKILKDKSNKNSLTIYRL